MCHRKNLCLLRILYVSIIFIFQLSAFNSATAQGSAFIASDQSRLLLPGSIKNVTIIDNELYCYVSGVLMKARCNGEQVLEFNADTNFAKLEDNIEYVVRHPISGDIYFTKRDKHGDSWLYLCTNNGHEEKKTKMLRIGGGLLNRGMTIEHPTFSKDGKTMIFSSAEREGANYNLWYSRFDGEDWGKPQTMGSRINSRGDELSPMIYGDYLIYSSNGYSEDSGYFALYSTKLYSSSATSDSNGRKQVGRCAVQRLPYPINVFSSDNFDMAVNTRTGCSYWISRRDNPVADSVLFSMSGRPEGVMLWGRVTDKGNRPLQDVNVSACQEGKNICTSRTNADGRYRMYLQADCYYELTYKLDNYFVNSEAINTVRPDRDYLVAEVQRDVTLDKLPLGQRIMFDDIYGPGVDVELSNRGIELLSPLVQFLNDNPTMLVEMSLSNDLTNDSTFNSLLTDQRIISLQAYLYPLLPSTVEISISNGCDGREGCDNASGLSRLTVLIYNNL